MKTTKLTVVYIGILLSIVFGFLLPGVHTRTHDIRPLYSDGQQLYVGSRLFRVGQNPYDHTSLAKGYAHFITTRQASPSPQIHLPATLVLLSPWSLLPWPVFCWCQIITGAFCIPFIACLCLKYVYAEPPLWLLWVSSLCIAVLPGTWQTFSLGQIVLPIIALTLLTARLLQSDRPHLSPLTSLLALIKFTLCLPLFLYLFIKGTKQTKVLIASGVLLYVGVNIIGAALIGPRQFLSSYQRNNKASFSSGTQNDVHGTGRRERVDVECLIADIGNPVVAEIVKTAICVVLILGFLWRWQQSQFGLADISALSLLALLVFYHRTYDTVLLAPSMVLVLSFLARRQLTGYRILFAIFLVVTLASIGSNTHNVVDLVLHHFGRLHPPYFKALCLLLDYILLTVGVLLPSRRTGSPSPVGLDPVLASTV